MAKMDAGVDDGVDDIAEQVKQQPQQGQHEQRAKDDGIVAVDGGLKTQQPQPV